MNETARALLREIILNGGVMRPPADSQVAVVTLLTERRAVDVGRGFISVPDMRADTLVMARGLMLDLEINRPYDVPDGVPGWAGLLEPESRRSEVYAAAREWLMSMGLVRVDGGQLHDNTGDALRADDRPRFVPDGWDGSARWEPVPVPTALTPAPLPTPSGTGHSDRPVELEPAGSARAHEKRVAEKVPAPTPVTPQQVSVPAADPSGPVIADHLGQLTALLAAVVSQGRLESTAADVEHRNRLTLARRVAVLLAAHGPMTRSDLTRMKLSTIQKDALTDAVEYALGTGAIKGGERRRLVLANPTLLGLDKQTVDAEVELIHQRAAERAAREANRATKAALDRVMT